MGSYKNAGNVFLCQMEQHYTSDLQEDAEIVRLPAMSVIKNGATTLLPISSPASDQVLYIILYITPLESAVFFQ